MQGNEEKKPFVHAAAASFPQEVFFGDHETKIAPMTVTTFDVFAAARSNQKSKQRR